MLNAGYEPLQIVSWQKAIVLWLQDKVEVLEYYSHEVRSPSRSFVLPSVLKLKHYIRPYRNYQAKLSRQNIFIRDEFTCQYCRAVFHPKKLTIDHVWPVSRGGKNSWENIVTACSPCNHRKGNRSPDEASMPLPHKPHRPSWLPSRQTKYKTENLPAAWLAYLEAV